MTRVHGLAASACLCALTASVGGCVSGMRYKVPMPSSLTLGTVRDEDATLAAGQARHATPRSDTEARGESRQQADTSSGIAVIK